MAFFSLTDIKFTPKKSSYNDKATIAGNEYDMTIKRFPSNLASDSQYGHYVVFYVNIQTKTQYEQNFANDTATAVQSNRQMIDNMRGAGTSTNGFSTIRQNLTTAVSNADIGGKINSFLENNSVGKVLSAAGKIVGNAAQTADKNTNILGFASESFNKLTSSLGDAFAFAENNFFRTTKRSTTAIALYMPDNLQFNYHQSFNDAGGSELLGAKGTAVTQAINSAVDAYNKTGEISSGLNNLSPFMAEGITKGAGNLIGGNGGQMFSAFTGVVNNPQMELLFQSTQRREFSFEFRMSPRSEQEAKDIMEIVRLFKFHSSPELMGNVSGRYLIPPSEFDIQFFYNGTVNPNIPSISTCVLESVSVNYAPDGWAAFEVSNNSKPTIGGTGMPVAISLSLHFKETQIITKEYLTQSQNGSTY